MIKKEFSVYFDRLIGHEGGYVNDLNDPGGETNWGISKRSYPNLDIKNLTRTQAKEIYQKDFWSPFADIYMPDAILWQMFDFAVNSGISTSIRALQRAIGVNDDGLFGPFSKSALAARDSNDVLFLLIAERIDWMRKAKNWKYHGNGWMARMSKNLRLAAEDN